MQEEDYVGLGMPVAEARRRARLGLGSTETVIENVRDVEFITMLEGCYRDFMLGLRALRKSPAFSLTAILTLGIGIGANTVVFTLLYGLLLRSLPVKDPASLVRIGVASETVDPSRASSVPNPMLLPNSAGNRSRSRTFRHGASPAAPWTPGMALHGC